jgi:hypothetical protein
MVRLRLRRRLKSLTRLSPPYKRNFLYILKNLCPAEPPGLTTAVGARLCENLPGPDREGILGNDEIR